MNKNNKNNHIRGSRGKLAFRLLLAAAIICGCTSLSLATKYSVISYNSSLSFDAVDVEVQQYSVMKGSLVKAVPDMEVGGGRVSYIPRILCSQASGYVRAQVELVSATGKAYQLTDQDVEGLGSGWIVREGNFYLTSPLDAGESSDIFQEILIPSDISTGGRFTVRVRADAVQASGWVPDFSAAQPWGDLEPESSGVCNADESGTWEGRPMPLLTYTSEGILKSNTVNLFGGFDTLMPGDVSSEILEIRNDGEAAASFYFRTAYRNEEISENVRLYVSYQNREIYRGRLGDESLSDYVKLAELEPGETGDFSFTVSVPLKTGNAMTGAKAEDIVWQFKAVEADKEAGYRACEDKNRDSQSRTVSHQAKSYTSGHEISQRERRLAALLRGSFDRGTVQTGQRYPLWIMWCGTGVLCLVAWGLLRGRSREHESTNASL